MNRRRRRDSDGFVAVEFVTGIAFLLVPTVMLVSSIANWYETRTTASALARTVAQSVADLPPSCEVTASQVSNIEGLGRVLASERGVSSESIDIGVSQGGRGESLKVRVTIMTPVTHIPLLGDIGSFPVEMTQSAPIDQYRNCS